MTRPLPFDNDDDYELLKKRWLGKYLGVEKITVRQLRTLLLQASQDAEKEVIALAKSSTFSAAVRTAQLRLMMKEIRDITNELFKEITPIVEQGQKQAAIAAVNAFSQTDRDYLSRALSASEGSVDDYIAGQRNSSMLGVANAINRLERSKQPLSARVYRSRRMANQWVERRITSALIRNSSAKELASQVKSSINPNVSGGVSYAALRLGRTELNNAFHATSVALAEDRPWIEGMRWRLSQTHDSSDINDPCESYSNQIFSVETVPKKPHPQCRCFTTPEVEPWESFLTNLTAGQYRIWISDAA